MNRKNDVIKFINRFTQNGSNHGVIDTFTNGCCFWFAHILAERFYDHDAWREDVEVMYAQIENHFGCRVDGRVYDITGDVTSKYQWVPWIIAAQEDGLRFERIVRDCIEF